MDKTQKIIVALLILAIIFSVVSVLVAVGALNVSLPDASTSARAVSTTDSATGQVQLTVEGNNYGG